MKKLLVLFTGILLVAQVKVNAQNKDSYISLGPVAGMGHSWITDVDDQVFKPSGYLGIGIIYSRYEHWGWGGEVLASHEGFSMRNPYNDEIAAIDPTYVRIIPKAYYFFGQYGSHVRPKIYLGPSLGIKVTEDHYHDDMINSMESIGVFNKDQVFNDVDFGLTGGVGVNIKLSKYTWLNMDGSYYHGLSDATAEGNRNRNLRFNAGIMFGIH